MLRIIKIALALAVAAWGLVGALGNLIDWAGTTGAVKAVTSMAGITGVPSVWRATSSPSIVLAGALFIVAFKLASALLCVGGSWRMWQARAGDQAIFSRAKALALSGCAVAVFGLFLGWIVIAEQWWESWRSPSMEVAGEFAFRYGGFIALIALIVGMQDD